MRDAVERADRQVKTGRPSRARPVPAPPQPREHHGFPFDITVEEFLSRRRRTIDV